MIWVEYKSLRIVHKYPRISSMGNISKGCGHLLNAEKCGIYKHEDCGDKMAGPWASDRA